ANSHEFRSHGQDWRGRIARRAQAQWRLAARRFSGGAGAAVFFRPRTAVRGDASGFAGGGGDAAKGRGRFAAAEGLAYSRSDFSGAVRARTARPTEHPWHRSIISLAALEQKPRRHSSRLG